MNAIYQSLLLSLGLLLCGPPPGVQASTLQQVWNFSAPALRDPELDPNGLRINILYEVSDYILPDMVNFKVSNWDCNETVEEWFVPSLISPPANFVQGDGSGDGVIEIEINVDPDAFDSAGGDKASYWQQDNQERYQVRFCLFAGVQTIEESPTIVDSSETQIAVTYDLTDGFAIGLEVVPVRREDSAEEAYGIDGYFCDRDGIKLSDDQIAELGATPGSSLEVCVTPDEAALATGSFQLDQIDLFEWIRMDSNGMEERQLAVENGKEAGDGLTELQCDENGLRCQFVSILKANFFQVTLPTPAPSAAPTQFPTPAPTPSPTFAPPPSGFQAVGEGYCIDAGGNRFNYYTNTLTPATSTAQCAQQCNTVAQSLNAYPEEVRGYEFDGIACRCLVDGGSGDRVIPDYSFTSAGGISAISIVATVDPAIDVQCHRYSAGSYTQQYSSYSYVGYVSQIGDSNSDCTDSSGQPIDYIALYDNKQLLGYNSASCMELCQNIVGLGLLGITIVSNPDATIPTAPYTGGGDYQCQCHALLTGPSDPKIVTAQNYPYPAGQGFASAASSQAGKVVAGTFQPGTSPSALCYRVTPPSMTFTGEGICSDTEGNGYDFYALNNPSGAPVTDCASQCDGLAQSFYTFNYPEAVRGFEYDGGCKCIVDSGYGDRAYPGFTFGSSVTTVSAISPVDTVVYVAGTSCFRHQDEKYRDPSFYSGYVSSIGSGMCSDGAGGISSMVSLYDVNQRYGLSTSSCAALCQKAVGLDYLGISILRDSLVDPIDAPYTGGGDYRCQCHVILDGPTDPRITQAQTAAYSSGQGFASAVATNLGTAISTSLGDTGNYCYVYNPVATSFVGEGRCTDSVDNRYDYYERNNPSGEVLASCSDECQSVEAALGPSVPEIMRGFEFDGRICRCLVDSGYGPRSMPDFTFGYAPTVTGAVSPIQGFTAETGVSCYERTRTSSSPGGYLRYLGSGYCTDGSTATPTDTLSLYDANQIGSSDSSSCAQLCTSVVGPSSLLGITLYRNVDENPSNTPYTGSGNFQCQCHVNLPGGPTDPILTSAQSYAYKSGQGFAFADTSQSGVAVTSRVAASNRACYRFYQSRRRQQQQQEDELWLQEEEAEVSSSVTTTSWSGSSSIPNDDSPILKGLTTTTTPIMKSSTVRGVRGGSWMEAEEEEPLLLPAEAEDNRRALQDASFAQIAGAGIGTLKFARRVYRRNLLTGQEEWSTDTTSTTTLQRRLQVGGATQSEFNLDLRVTTFQRQARRRSASSRRQACHSLLLLFSGVVSMLFLVVS